MNQARNQLPGDDQFSQDVPNTNPFTADLKGEFTSNFGTNTNAVSQIFKEGGFVNDKRRMYVLLGAILLLALGVVWYFSSSSDEVTDESMVEEAASEDGSEENMEEAAADGETPADGEKKDGETAGAPTDAAIPAATDAAAPADPALAGATAAASGAASIVGPADGQARDYDEASEPATFEWQGDAQYIVFSKTQAMNAVIRKVNIQGSTQYRFLNPHPGTWYWQLQNADGSPITEARAFTINAPQRLGLTIGSPAAGSGLAGNGGVVSWTAPHTRVAFYRVEFSAAGSFARPDFKFATSGTSVQVSGVAPGNYQMRLGGFSEVSGQWEYSAPVAVTVQ